MAAANTVEWLYNQLSTEVNDWVQLGAGMNIDEFKYLGVNMDELVAALMAKAGTFTKLRDDMVTIIVVSQIRSIVKDKMTRRMSPGGKARLDAIFNHYGFVPHNKNVPITTPTIPRALSLFLQIIFKIRGAQPTLCRVLGTVPVGLNRALCFPGGCAMIKVGNHDLVAKWVTWYTSFCTEVKMNPMPSQEQMLYSQKYSKVDDSERE
jgi:hypothetical protein